MTHPWIANTPTLPLLLNSFINLFMRFFNNVTISGKLLTSRVSFSAQPQFATIILSIRIVMKKFVSSSSTMSLFSSHLYQLTSAVLTRSFTDVLLLELSSLHLLLLLLVMVNGCGPESRQASQSSIQPE